jgi:hypothetical protein
MQFHCNYLQMTDSKNMKFCTYHILNAYHQTVFRIVLYLNYKHRDSAKHSARIWQIARMTYTRKNYEQKINNWCTETKAGIVTFLEPFFTFLTY